MTTHTLRLLFLLTFLNLGTTVSAAEKVRRLEVLFLGSPNSSHKPLERFKTIRRALGVKGVNFTYFNQPTALTKENLAKYDALLVYGNHDVLKKDQELALLDYSKNGGACVFLHSSCGCFRNSEAFIKLLGAQFKSHGRGVFRVDTVLPDHELMKGYEGFECWDETYIHQKHNPDRTVLQKHKEEPWTWVRTHGKGRIFYTASGHDERCWQQPNYQDLVLRGILWSVGSEKAQLVSNLKLPKLSFYTSNVNIVPAKSWGVPLDRRVPHTVLQNPLPVTESLKLAQVPVDFTLQIFASEPDIINPIAINWDAQGRMWAVEAYDYPNNHVMNKPGLDRIKILEDTDHDGKADKVSVFASGLTICTSVLPYKKGCITTDGEQMIYLADTDGDGKADKREVLFSGLNIRDTHACTSNLRYGFDGWIYATVGYSGIDIRIKAKRHKSGQCVFRFKPDGSDLEILQSTTNNTWGLGFTEQGRIMGSTANNNPSWWLDVPLSAYQKSGIKAERTPRADSVDKFFPLTFDYLQVDCKEGVTAGAGHAIYTARLFPDDWHNQRALICAPTGKLVVAPRIERRGSGFKTTHFEQNLYASADAWSAPVAAEVGPDGAVYIADWYNSIVQHNVYGDDQKRGKGNAYITEHRDRKHGRIYRIVPKGSKPSAFPKMDTLENQIAALSHSNLFWRLTAQRLIIEHHSEKAIPLLKAQLTAGTSKKIHTFQLLAQLSPMDALTIGARIFDQAHKTQPSFQRPYIEAIPATEKTSLSLINSLEIMTPDARHAILLHASKVPKSEAVLTALNKKKELLHKDKTLLPALTVALASHGAAPSTGQPRQHSLSASAKRGAKIYQSATCVACHQDHGEGLEKTFPPLNKSEWLSRNHEDAIRIVLKGLTGPVKVRGKDYNGGMPAQENLTDRQIADVLNYTRNSWDNKLGDITVKEVTRVRAELKDRKLPFTAKDFKKVSTPEPNHSYNFAKGLEDTIGHAHAHISGGNRPVKIGTGGIDLTANNGERCTQIKSDQFIDLPNNIISNAANQGVIGELSIETWLQVNENRPWAWAWGFGSSDQGEGKSGGAAQSDYLALIPMNAHNKKLRLCARGGGKEYFFDTKATLETNKMHHIIATYSRSHMALYLNGKLVGRHALPEKLNLTTFKNDNNWLGRSQFPDPVFDGSFLRLRIYPFALNAETVEACAKQAQIER